MRASATRTVDFLLLLVLTLGLLLSASRAFATSACEPPQLPSAQVTAFPQVVCPQLLELDLSPTVQDRRFSVAGGQRLYLRFSNARIDVANGRLVCEYEHELFNLPGDRLVLNGDTDSTCVSGIGLTIASDASPPLDAWRLPPPGVVRLEERVDSWTWSEEREAALPPPSLMSCFECPPFRDWGVTGRPRCTYSSEVAPTSRTELHRATRGCRMNDRGDGFICPLGVPRAP